jgi:hypothetical protein
MERACADATVPAGFPALRGARIMRCMLAASKAGGTHRLCARPSRRNDAEGDKVDCHKTETGIVSFGVKRIKSPDHDHVGSLGI